MDVYQVVELKEIKYFVLAHGYARVITIDGNRLCASDFKVGTTHLEFKPQEPSALEFIRMLENQK